MGSLSNAVFFPSPNDNTSECAGEKSSYDAPIACIPILSDTTYRMCAVHFGLSHCINTEIIVTLNRHFKKKKKKKKKKKRTRRALKGKTFNAYAKDEGPILFVYQLYPSHVPTMQSYSLHRKFDATLQVTCKHEPVHISTC